MGSINLPAQSEGKFLKDNGTWDSPPSSPSGNMIVVNLVADSAAVTWTNMPSAATIFAGAHRHVAMADLSGFSEVRLVVNKQATAGAANAVIGLAYATQFATSAAGYSQIGESPVQVAVNVTNTVLNSGWVALVAGAQADVYLALVGSGGDGVLDPAFGAISAQFR